MPPEQQALVKLAEEQLTEATLLANNNLFKGAISRAYYAMFHLAEAVLLQDGLAFSKHSAVVAKFGEHFTAKSRMPLQLHRYLIDGQADRHRSDYDAIASFDAAKAQEHLAHAQEFLQETLKFLNPPA